MSEKRFGMLIDLSLCVGCNACAVACKQENAVPLAKFNTWVESWDVDDGGIVRRANVPKHAPTRLAGSTTRPARWASARSATIAPPMASCRPAWAPA